MSEGIDTQNIGVVNAKRNENSERNAKGNGKGESGMGNKASAEMENLANTPAGNQTWNLQQKSDEQALGNV